MSNKLSFNRHPWVVMGVGLFVLTIGCTSLIAAASLLPTPTLMILTGVILMVLTFFLSQNITHPHLTTSGVAEIPCPACQEAHKPGTLFCQVCGRELIPSPISRASSLASSRQNELIPGYLVVILLLLFLSLILGGV